jgi:hypothetical protein
VFAKAVSLELSQEAFMLATSMLPNSSGDAPEGKQLTTDSFCKEKK